MNPVEAMRKQIADIKEIAKEKQLNQEDTDLLIYLQGVSDAVQVEKYIGAEGK